MTIIRKGIDIEYDDEQELLTGHHKVKRFEKRIISYTLHQMPVQDIEIESYIPCQPTYFPGDNKPQQEGERGWSGSNPKADAPTGKLNATGVIDFKTSVRTRANIIFVGDSLSLQGADWMGDSLGIISFENLHHTDQRKLRSRISYTQHGGSVAYMFARSLLIPEYENTKWFLEDVQELNGRLKNGVKHWDVCVNRIPVPHIDFASISQKDLDLHFENMREYYGCLIVIVTNPTWHNNMVSKRKVKEYLDFNRRFPSYLRRKGLFLLDNDGYTRSLIEANGEQMGLSKDEIFNLRLITPGRSFYPIQAMICRHKVPGSQGWCFPNMISSDGMHWCPQPLAPRYSAAIACIIYCTLEPYKSDERPQACAKRCNEDYQSLKPVAFDETAEKYPPFGRIERLLHKDKL
jgi:hypothetical protein